MQTNALKLAQQREGHHSAERLCLETIELQVTNLARSVDFWTNTLGFVIRQQDSHKAVLGTQNRPLVTLHSGATQSVAGRHLGMYHVAFGLPEQAEFSRILARLIDLRVPVSVVDHLMSKAIYLHDPDGLEIEFAFETPERFGRFGDMSKGVVMYDTQGKLHSGRAGLPVGSELVYAKGADITLPLDPNSVIAHLHFKVADLESATDWFERLGFARNLMIPSFGFADLGAGTTYTHRIAVNIWSGTDLLPTPDTMARLVNYTLQANELIPIDTVNALTPTENGLTGIDPSGTRFTLLEQRLQHAGDI